MVSPLVGRLLVSFNLQSAVCSVQSAICKCGTLVVVLVEYCTSMYDSFYVENADRGDSLAIRCQ